MGKSQTPQYKTESMIILLSNASIMASPLTAAYQLDSGPDWGHRIRIVVGDTFCDGDGAYRAGGEWGTLSELSLTTSLGRRHGGRGTWKTVCGRERECDGPVCHQNLNRLLSCQRITKWPLPSRLGIGRTLCAMDRCLGRGRGQMSAEKPKDGDKWEQGGEKPTKELVGQACGNNWQSECNTHGYSPILEGTDLPSAFRFTPVPVSA